MNEIIIQEMRSILHRYNIKRYMDWENRNKFDPEASPYGNIAPAPIAIEKFEENMDWDWLVHNYHISPEFIYEFRHRLDMDYLLDNHVITQRQLKKVMKRNKVDRFDILDLE